ncbi:cold shock domain-containing protein [Niveibacterium umoris]|uniref:Cold shock CspA family protein n=1 Tax=Niveibacterium umoris TaxID=1193620 RepID=A0A840BNM8_9RHOO|nr:cold shock domain-containing protein [Niveibacterium umoris]MBB4013099.1 cold shock CspA family protein [Niveibacterium umoris]
MRFDGTLTKWNDDRGFGFVTPDVGDGELFAHISAFPKQGGRPVVGERVSFEVTAGQGGKKKAVNIAYLARPSRQAPLRRARPQTARRSRDGVIGALILVLIVAGAIYGYAPRRHAAPAHTSIEPAALSTSARLSCDGRTHCSQMTSCEEATYFLRNCPGVEMDGNHNGVPCEQQWCGASLAH